jgi:hypothetical protein
MPAQFQFLFVVSIQLPTPDVAADERSSAHANVLEPVWPAVLFVQPCLAIGETAGNATLALGRVGAVEVGNMLVADIAEPFEKRS